MQKELEKEWKITARFLQNDIGSHQTWKQCPKVFNFFIFIFTRVLPERNTFSFPNAILSSIEEYSSKWHQYHKWFPYDLHVPTCFGFVISASVGQLHLRFPFNCGKITGLTSLCKFQLHSSAEKWSRALVEILQLFQILWITFHKWLAWVTRKQAKGHTVCDYWTMVYGSSQ